MVYVLWKGNRMFGVKISIDDRSVFSYLEWKVYLWWFGCPSAIELTYKEHVRERNQCYSDCRPVEFHVSASTKEDRAVTWREFPKLPREARSPSCRSPLNVNHVSRVRTASLPVVRELCVPSSVLKMVSQSTLFLSASLYRLLTGQSKYFEPCYKCDVRLLPRARGRNFLRVPSFHGIKHRLSLLPIYQLFIVSRLISIR